MHRVSVALGQGREEWDTGRVSKLRAGAAALLAVAAGAWGLWLGQTSSLAPEPSTARPAADRATASAGAAPAAGALPLEGFLVVLDPGHNSGNADAPGTINALVDDGRGGLKPCNTVGTYTPDGYPEYAFTFDVAERAAALLEERGVRVVATRGPDGVGPCVDERGRAGAVHGADVVVSIHGNGSDAPGTAGFFAMVSDPPLNPAQGEPSRALAAALIGQLAAQGFPPSNVVPGALQPRADIALLNFADRPTVLLELAEFRNPAEGAAVQDPAVRQRYAAAIAAGVEDFLAPG